jgi:hypothetical protein
VYTGRFHKPNPCVALLFECVIATLREFAHDPRHLGAEPGMTAVLHTWARRSICTSTCTASSPAAG